MVTSLQAVRTMSAPFSCVVLVHGMLMPTHPRPIANFAHLTQVPHMTWYLGSNLFMLGTRNSLPLHTPFHRVIVHAQTATLNELERSNPLSNVSMCSNVTGGCFTLVEDSGTIFFTAAFAI